MPGVICHRTPSQDCILLGHLYRSSYDRTDTSPSGSSRTFQKSGPSGSPLAGHCAKSKPNCRLCSLARPRLTLLSISTEITLLVLSQLPGLEILKCRSVCSTFKRLIDQSKKLQYIIQSNIRGLEPLGDSSSANSDLTKLLSRERSWTMFGSTAGAYSSLQNPPNLTNGPAPKLRSTYDHGKLVLSRGNQVVEHSLDPAQAFDPQEYEIPSFGAECSVTSANDLFVYSTGGEIHIYSKTDGEIVNVLSAPHIGNLGVPSIRRSWIAALFRSERRCDGVLIWNWKSGKLIDTLYDAHSPVLSIAFLDDTTLVAVHTNRSACTARVDTYELSDKQVVLKSSVSLPDAHPSKWYAKADIYTSGESARPGFERMLCNQGIVAIDLEMRIRAPHNPETVTADRRLNAILVIHKHIFTPPYLARSGEPVTPIPWTNWSTNHFRILTGVRLSPQSPVWGHRLVAVGPEIDKVSLFDFCPMGIKAVAQVWKGNGTWGASPYGRGGVSVRAALAQRARTLVRASTLGAVVGWFDNLNPTSAQIPYVVSVRRGMIDVVDTMMDESSIVLTMWEGDLSEQSASTRVIAFNLGS